MIGSCLEQWKGDEDELEGPSVSSAGRGGVLFCS